MLTLACACASNYASVCCSNDNGFEASGKNMEFSSRDTAIVSREVLLYLSTAYISTSML